MSTAGWHAELDLSFSRRAARTVLSGNRHRGPLQVQKALYPEGGTICHVTVLHPPGGIAAGDELAIRTVLQEGAHALLTTPGATKWYRSEDAWARQHLRFSLAEAAVLEWLPRENIFFDRSNVSMTLDVDLAERATYFGWDIFSFGRRAAGESWRAGKLHMHTRLRRAGRLLWAENADVEAGSGFAQSAVGLAHRTVAGTFVVAGCEVEEALLKACRDRKASGVAARTGITRLPGALIARYLGNSTEEAFAWFTRLWELLREGLLSKTAHAPRVWAC